MKKTIFGVVLLAVLLVGCANDQGASTVMKSDENTEVNGENVGGGDVEDNDEAAVTLRLSAKNFVFIMDGKENPELRVKEGQKVKIELTGEEGMHDFLIDELSVATERVTAGNTTSVDFVASKKGSFAYYCSVGSHRANGMEGVIVVE